MVRPRSSSSVLFRTMRILEGVNLLLVAGVALVGGLFVLGNYNEFLDESQLMLLQILSAVSALCLASGVCYAGSLVIWMARRGRFMVVRLLYSLFSCAIGTAAVLLTGILQALVRPV